MTVIERLAQFVADTEAVPGSTVAATQHCLLDLTTAAIVGLASEGGQAGRVAAAALWGRGSSACWFGGADLTIAGATYANATIASMLDLDDGHRLAAGHPGAAIIPAVLAEADASPMPTERILTAIAIGYEVALRVGGARDFVRLDSTATGRWCGLGVAAALAWMRRLPPAQIAQAIGIAASSAPNMNVSGYHTVAGHVKEGIPWAAVTGVAAVELAAARSVGSLLSLDDPRFYDGDAITRGLGAGWLIETTYFKPYSCCRWAHAALDAMDRLIADGLQPGTIERIEIDTFQRALSLGNAAAPATPEAAQYSVPFMVALLALRGRDALLPFRTTSLDDAEVVQLAGRVTLRLDPAFQAMFSAKVPARVVVHAAARRWEQTVLEPFGEPTNPMRWDDLVAKLHVATRGLIDPARKDALLRATDDLRAGSIDKLREALRQPCLAPARQAAA